MELNLHLIRDELADYPWNGSLSSVPYEAACRYVLYCSGTPETISERVLYVLPSAAMPAALPAGCSVICLGTVPSSVMAQKADLLSLPDTTDLDALMRDLCDCFDRYNVWENSLQEVVDHRAAAHTLAQRAGVMIHNPISACSDGYKVLFHYLPESQSLSLSEYRERYRYLEEGSADTLNLADLSTFYASEFADVLEHLEAPAQLHDNSSDMDFLEYTVRSHGKTIAFISINALLTPIRPRDYLLICVLGRYLDKLLQSVYLEAPGQPTQINTLLTRLVNHRLVPEDTIRNTLQTTQWEIDDSYLVLAVSPGLESAEPFSPGHLASIALSLSLDLPHCFYVLVENSLVFLCNLSRARTDRDSFLAKVDSIIAHTPVHVGSSAVFFDVKYMYYYWLQAHFALTCMQAEAGSLQIKRFESCRVPYAVSKLLADDVPETFIPEGLSRLIAYDQRNHTNYVEVLRVYLDNCCRIADSIRCLYIARNTFIYQMKKIRQITGLDPDKGQERLVYLLGYAVLDSLGVFDAQS